MSFQENLIALLKTKPDFVDMEGDLLQAAVIDAAYKIDPDLIKLLISDQNIKKKFFSEIAEHRVFDINTFVDYVSDKNFLNDSYTKFKNKIGLTIDGKSLRERGEVALVRPYKDCILEGGMTKEDQKRKEIFFNQVLAQDEIDKLLEPKLLTNWKRYTAEGEQAVGEIKRDEEGTIRENLIIKGNNLLALHSLKKEFTGKVKLIYIDPPYNTPGPNNTFSYNNNFNHSSRLTFMKNRLDAAKTLLTKDGCMIVAIDENEQKYLGVMIDEIFKDHETHCITIVHNPRGVQGTNFSYTHEYAYFIIPKGIKSIENRKIEEEDIKWRGLRDNGGESLRTDARNCFYGIIIDKNTKQVVDFTDVCEESYHPENNISNGDFIEIYPIDKEGIERKRRYARQSIDEVKDLLRVTEKNGIYDIQIGKDFGQYRTVRVDKRYDSNEYGTKLVKELVPNSNFSFPKSLRNVYDCLYAVVSKDKDAIVLDYHAGSGTTGHAVLKLNQEDGGNRKFILIEQMDYITSITCPRIQKAIQNEVLNDNFIYCSLKEYNEDFINHIQEATDTQALLTIREEMKAKSFLDRNVDLTQQEQAMEEFMTLPLDKQKAALVELLNKNQLYINLSDIDDQDFAISEEDKGMNRKFYQL